MAESMTAQGLVLAWPWALVLLPLPWLLRRWLRPAPDAGTQALRVPWFGLMQDTNATWLKKPLLAAIATLAWLLLMIAAARPQWVGEIVTLPVTGRDLLLAVDISGSMDTQDMFLAGEPVNRLSVVKKVAGEFIQRRRGDRVGLVLFGSRAYLQTPLTFDTETTAILLAESEIGLAGRETAIGDAIGLAVKRLKDQPEENRILILLTDGDNNAGQLDPAQAAAPPPQPAAPPVAEPAPAPPQGPQPDVATDVPHVPVPEAGVVEPLHRVVHVQAVNGLGRRLDVPRDQPDAEILGDHLDPGLEIDVAIRSHGIPWEWPEAALIPCAGRTMCREPVILAGCRTCIQLISRLRMRLQGKKWKRPGV